MRVDSSGNVSTRLQRRYLTGEVTTVVYLHSDSSYSYWMRAAVENRHLHHIYGASPEGHKAHADLDRDIRSVFLTPSPIAPNATNHNGSDCNAGPEDRRVSRKSV